MGFGFEIECEGELHKRLWWEMGGELPLSENGNSELEGPMYPLLMMKTPQYPQKFNVNVQTRKSLQNIRVNSD